MRTFVLIIEPYDFRIKKNVEKENTEFLSGRQN